MRSHGIDRQNAAAARWDQLLMLAACLSATAYFADHIRYGHHGLEARSRLKEREALLDFEIKGLESVRGKLAHDVALLSPEVPDSDLVEETARDVLGYVRPDERIIMAH
jgi:cell division protein FtsB